MSEKVIKINYPGWYQDVRCSEKKGKERCDGCAMVPVTMLDKAQLRSGNINDIAFHSVKFTCGHVHNVKVVT